MEPVNQLLGVHIYGFGVDCPSLQSSSNVTIISTNPFEYINGLKGCLGFVRKETLGLWGPRILALTKLIDCA